MARNTHQAALTLAIQQSSFARLYVCYSADVQASSKKNPKNKKKPKKQKKKKTKKPTFLVDITFPWLCPFRKDFHGQSICNAKGDDPAPHHCRCHQLNA